jgi:hypothetical protein
MILLKNNNDLKRYYYIILMNCNKCKKNKELTNFCENNKQYKTCSTCRQISKDWRAKNKEVVSLYNKNYNEKKIDNTEIDVVYAKKAGSNDEWQKFNSQLELAKTLELYTSNVSKVINGELKTTGGYEIKREKEIYKSTGPDWKKVKEENNIVDKCKGQPSSKRILHEIIDNIIGKKCCACQNWKQLSDYNYCKNHWDNLRNDCKDCLVKYRKDNKEKITATIVKYEKERKKVDPAFKLLKTLRTRLGSALKNQNAIKSNNTMELIGCSISFLRGYLEAKFTEGMSWDNHGEWHIDHIKPCASFNLLDDEEQQKCFHYKNLQPLWAQENLSKGAKIIEL